MIYRMLTKIYDICHICEKEAGDMKTSAASRDQIKKLVEYGMEASKLNGVTLCEYEREEYICMEDCPLEALYVFISGRAKVSFIADNGRSLLLGFYNGRGLIGDLEFMTGSDTAHMGIQAVTPVKCLAVPLALNREELQKNCRFLMCAGGDLAEKLSSSNDNCAQIILYPLEKRLCSYIEATAENGCFRERLTLTSELLGTSYRHLMRALEALCEKGVLEKRGKIYHISDRDKLSQNGMGAYELWNGGRQRFSVDTE
ncbi:MAG: cyclic nucleotide-binding domain-containing protein [Clostridia bacterium]|nr:cyclic nucleotide-binding domain-containing protein [Clostridia bacterium]